MKIYDDYQAYYEDNNDYFIWVFFCLVGILLVLIISGIAFSIIDSGNNKPIKIDPNIVFKYSDVNGSGPGILISNMAATPDEVGKKLNGNNQYFDFTVSGDLKNNAAKYSILLKKDDISTLSDDSVKVYLTKIDGVLENDILSTPYLYSDLKSIKVEDEDYKVIYEKTYNDLTTNFSDSYRLRMWIKIDAEDYYGKDYSLKVSVMAEGLGE